jgi:hypothetical protein
MEVRSGLPTGLQPPLDAAIHNAEILFLKAKQEPHDLDFYWWREPTLRCIKLVYFAFGDQACQAGRDNLWTGEQIRENLPKYLEDIVDCYFSEKCKPYISLDPYAPTREKEGFKKAILDSQEWADLQGKLAEVARSRQENTTSRVVAKQRQNSLEQGNIGQRIKQLMDESRLTEQELAEKIDIDVRSVQRHIAGSAARKKQIRAYEALFTKLLKRNILLNKTS